MGIPCKITRPLMTAIYTDVSAPRRNVARDALIRSRSQPLEVSPPSFPGRSNDFDARKERFMKVAWRHSCKGSLADAGDIVVGDYPCSNDHGLLANHDPETVTRGRHAYFSIEDAYASGAARRVIRVLESPNDWKEASNEHFGRNPMGRVISLRAKLSLAWIKPGQSPPDFHSQCVEIADVVAELGKLVDDHYKYSPCSKTTLAPTTME